MRIRPPNTVHILCASFFATSLDVVDEAERPIAPINVFSSIGVYELKFARGKMDQVELENLALAFLIWPHRPIRHNSRKTI
jgi:hypothetical protein